MFHLLVAYQGWSDSGGPMQNSRIYIRPNEEPGQTFFTNGKLDISQISKLPALLVTETGGMGPLHAKVANITKITEGPKDTSIQYAIDVSIPQISNHELESFPTQLGLGRFNLSHTCWRLYDVNIYRLILLIHQKSTINFIGRPMPAVAALGSWIASWDGRLRQLQEGGR